MVSKSELFPMKREPDSCVLPSARLKLLDSGSLRILLSVDSLSTRGSSLKSQEIVIKNVRENKRYLIFFFFKDLNLDDLLKSFQR